MNQKTVLCVISNVHLSMWCTYIPYYYFFLLFSCVLLLHSNIDFQKTTLFRVPSHLLSSSVLLLVHTHTTKFNHNFGILSPTRKQQQQESPCVSLRLVGIQMKIYGFFWNVHFRPLIISAIIIVFSQFSMAITISRLIPFNSRATLLKGNVFEKH